MTMPADLRPVVAWPRSHWPSADSSFDLRPFSLSSVSPFAGGQSVYGPLVQLWAIDMVTDERIGLWWRQMSATLSRIGGRAHLIRMGDPMRRRPWRNRSHAPIEEPFSDDTFFDDGHGLASGMLPPLAIVGAAEAADADSIIVAGLPPSLAPALFPGDLIEIRPYGKPARHGHLYEVASAAPTDVAGRTRARIIPPLRRPVRLGDQAVLDHPTTLFRAAGDEIEVRRTWPDLGRSSLQLVEEIHG